MKKKLIYSIIVIVISLGIFGIYNITKKNKIENAYNSLVRIEAYDDNTISSGFGFVYKVINDKSYIITNYHVIEGYFNFYVYDIYNKKAKARLIDYDINNDIAILSINNILNLKEVNIENSDNIKINDEVYILGDPSNTKKIGIEKQGRIIDTQYNMDNIYDFKTLAISSNVDYGNSGSPVFNKGGKIIGMLFLMKEDSKNICLAIPINYIVNFVDENKFNENTPSLGAVMTNTSNIEIIKEYNIKLPEINGVVILKLSDDSILKKNKLKNGDIITSFNKIEIKNIDDLKKELYKLNVGDEIEIKYYSSESYKSIKLKL